MTLGHDYDDHQDIKYPDNYSNQEKTYQEGFHQDSRLHYDHDVYGDIGGAQDLINFRYNLPLRFRNTTGQGRWNIYIQYQ